MNIPVIQPFPYDILLRYLEDRLIPDHERVMDNCYIRFGDNYNLQVSYDEKRSQLVLNIEGDYDHKHILRRVKCLFQTDYENTANKLLLKDPLLKSWVTKAPGLRPLGCWDAFELVVRTITGQQVTVAAAQTITRRIVERCGSLTPENIATSDLSKIGMPTRRAQTLQRVAENILTRELNLTAQWPTLAQQLSAISGIGPWTVAYLGIRLGRDPNAFPHSDIGLMRAANADNPKALLHKATAWEPNRALAATYLWMSDYL